MFHVHDYEMMFRDSVLPNGCTCTTLYQRKCCDKDCNPTLEYDLICRCGDVAPDMADAVHRELRSKMFGLTLQVGLGIVFGAGAMLLYITQ